MRCLIQRCWSCRVFNSIGTEIFFSLSHIHACTICLIGMFANQCVQYSHITFPFLTLSSLTYTHTPEGRMRDLFPSLRGAAFWKGHWRIRFNFYSSSPVKIHKTINKSFLMWARAPRAVADLTPGPVSSASNPHLFLSLSVFTHFLKNIISLISSVLSVISIFFFYLRSQQGWF